MNKLQVKNIKKRAKIAAETKDRTDYWVLGIVAIVAVVGLVILFESRLELKGNISPESVDSITASAFKTSRQDCISSSTRPCYDKQTGKKIIELNPESGAKEFEACMKSASESQRSEATQATPICADEIYYYCNEGKSGVMIKKFSGKCKTVPPVTVVYPNGGEELLQGYYYVNPIDERIYWRGENYDLKFSGGRGKFHVMIVKEEATNNADPTDLIAGYVLSGALPFPVIPASSYNTVDYPLFAGNSFTDSETGVHYILSAWNPFVACKEPWGAACYYLPPGKYKILVISENEKGQILYWDYAANKPGNWDISDKAFIVAPHSNIELLSPNGGEIFAPGDEVTVSWTAKGIDSRKVGIALLRKDKQFMIFLATNVPLSSEAGTFTYTWKIPDWSEFKDYTDNWYIAVQEVIEGEPGGTFYIVESPQGHATGVSNAPFTIGPKI